MYKKISLYTLPAVLVLLMSCGAPKNTTSKEGSNKILGTYWELETLHGERVDFAFRGNKKVGFQMDEEHQRVSGFAGCNQFTGAYRDVGGEEHKLHFSGMASTRMACPNNPFDEKDYLKTLGEVSSYELKGNVLTLMNESGKILATFHKPLKNINPIEEKYWKLSMLNGEEVKDIALSRDIHFILRAHDHKVEGFSGCNNFFGNYTLKDDNKIEFLKMAGTLKACPNVDFDEAQFLKVLNEADQFEQKEDRLTLKKGNKDLATFEAIYF